MNQRVAIVDRASARRKGFGMDREARETGGLDPARDRSRGDEARRVTALLLPAMNQGGGNEREVKEALAMVSVHSDPLAFVADVARSHAHKKDPMSGWPARPEVLAAMPAPIRLLTGEPERGGNRGFSRIRWLTNWGSLAATLVAR